MSLVSTKASSPFLKPNSSQDITLGSLSKCSLKTDQAYDRQWMSTHEVFWQYPLVTSSQLGVVRPFDGLDLRFGSFSQRLMS